MLQNRYKGVAVKRLQDLEPDGVSGYPGRIEREVNRVRHVLERVVEPSVPPVPELGVEAEQDGGSEHDDEQAVPRPGPGGQRADTSPAGPGGPDWPGSPRRRLTRRGRRHYPQAVPSCAGLITLTMNKRPVPCVRPPPTVIRCATRDGLCGRIR